MLTSSGTITEPAQPAISVENPDKTDNFFTENTRGENTEYPGDDNIEDSKDENPVSSGQRDPRITDPAVLSQIESMGGGNIGLVYKWSTKEGVMEWTVGEQTYNPELSYTIKQAPATGEFLHFNEMTGKFSYKGAESVQFDFFTFTTLKQGSAIADTLVLIIFTQ